MMWTVVCVSQSKCSTGWRNGNASLLLLLTPRELRQWRSSKPALYTPRALKTDGYGGAALATDGFN